MTEHWSDCAVYNEPAYPKGECDCGGRKDKLCHFSLTRTTNGGWIAAHLDPDVYIKINPYHLARMFLDEIAKRLGDDVKKQMERGKE